MSKYVINKGCCVCGKIETGLAEMTVGKSKHTLCYKCMYEFIEDLKLYQDMNYSEADVKKIYEQKVGAE